MKTIVDYARKVKEQHALNKNLAPIEADASASSKAYAIGQHFILNGELYKAKTAIALGDALVLDTNYEAAGSIEAQIETLDAENQTLANLRAELGAHNLYPLMFVSTLKSLNTGGTWSGNNYTYHDVVFSISADDKGVVQKINVNGTNSASGITVFILPKTEKISGNYIISGCPSGGGSSTYQLRIGKGDSATYVGTETGSGFAISLSNEKCEIQIHVAAGASVSNKDFYPMLRLATDKDTSFQVGSMTNKELTEKVSIKSGSILNIPTSNGTANIWYAKVGHIVFANIEVAPADTWDVGSSNRITFNRPSELPLPYSSVSGANLNQIALSLGSSSFILQNNYTSALGAGNNQQLSITYITAE